ncbi:MAG: hypothetical protein ACYDD7_04105, partial [Acidimicrobiales bacterium]
MRQSPEDRALYCRQLRDTVRDVFLPELTSALARDAAGLVDRILAEFVVEEESAAAVAAEFGPAFGLLLERGDAVETPEGFDDLRRQATVVVARTVGSADDSERALGLRLVAIERRYIERVDELRTAVLAGGRDSEERSSASECSVTSEQITDYLRRRLARSPDVSVTSATVVPGGRSKETILVAMTGSDELPSEVILRKDRPVGVLQTRAVDEFAVIKAVHEFGGV